MKLLFFKIAAIAAGVAFALAALLGGIYWYSTRPVPEKPWDESAFTAEGNTGFAQDDDGYIVFVYTIRNHTDRDFNQDGDYRYKLLVVQPDKSLSEVIPSDKGIILVATPIFIPPRQTGTLKLRLRGSIPRKAGTSDDEFHESLRKYVVSMLNDGEYFALFDETRHCRINLPAVSKGKPPKS